MKIELMFLYGWPWKYTCDNIKLDIEEPRWESVKWIHLIQDWGALVSTVTNVRLTWTARDVLTSSGLTELVSRACHVTRNIPRDLSDVTTMVSMITSHGHDGDSFVSDVGTWVWMARTGLWQGALPCECYKSHTSLKFKQSNKNLCLNVESGTDRLTRNVGNQISTYAA